MRYTFNPNERRGLVTLCIIIAVMFGAIVWVRHRSAPAVTEEPAVVWRQSDADADADSISTRKSKKKIKKVGSKHSRTDKAGGKHSRTDKAGSKKASKSKDAAPPLKSRDFLRDTIPG